jgi:predicted flavoprotein YhiN
MAGAVVVGGGASGVLAAAQLVLRGAEVTLLEPCAKLGRGMAYSTSCPLP